MWKAIKGFVWWTHPRGSLPYDVMVTLILAFIFISPRFLDFHDNPAPSHGSRSYLVDAASVPAPDDPSFRSALARQLGGEVDQWEPLRGPSGNVSAYRVFLKEKAKKGTR